MNYRLIIFFIVMLFLAPGLPVSAQDSTPTPECPPLKDARDIDARPWSLEESCFTVEGEVDDLNVAPPGMGFDLLDEDQFLQSYFMLRIRPESGDTVSVGVQVDSDLAGIYNGDVVIVTGILVGSIEGSNAFGKEVEIQLMEATTVELVVELATPQP